jgi:hypothetical protein
MGMTLGPGVPLRLTISDPFDLSQELDVEITAIESFLDGAETERILVDLPVPLSWAGIDYDRLVLERRSSPGLLDELQLGQAVDCNGYGTLAGPEDQAPWGVETWRGGLAILGTVSVR